MGKTVRSIIAIAVVVAILGGLCFYFIRETIEKELENIFSIDHNCTVDVAVASVNIPLVLEDSNIKYTSKVPENGFYRWEDDKKYILACPGINNVLKYGE